MLQILGDLEALGKELGNGTPFRQQVKIGIDEVAADLGRSVELVYELLPRTEGSKL